MTAITPDELSRRAQRSLGRAAGDRRAQLALGALGAAGAAAAGAVGIERLKEALSEDGTEGEPLRSYRFKCKESVAEGIVRVAAGRMDDALEQLREKADDDFAAAVHEARKDLKKLRAVLRLARPALGEDLYRRENRRARDAGRLLSGARDAQVKLDTLEALRERFSEDDEGKRLEPYAKKLEQDLEAAKQNGDAADKLETAAREIEAARAGLDGWSLKGKGWELIEAGLARSYRRGRKRYRTAAADPSGENMHEWRKRVKDHWYHLRLVRDSWQPVLGAIADEAHELADLVGDDHDLVVLREDALASGGAFEKPGDLKLLEELIDRRRAELIDRSLELGGRVYAESPKQFVSRIGTYWEAWREACRNSS